MHRTNSERKEWQALTGPMHCSTFLLTPAGLLMEDLPQSRHTPTRIPSSAHRLVTTPGSSAVEHLFPAAAQLLKPIQNHVELPRYGPGIAANH
jgi:hypothetical protein